MNGPIDITFDFRTDTPGFPKRDPDAVSPTLRRYHMILWSKPLPSGTPFTLNGTTPWAYLHHKSDLGEFFLSSDTTNSSYKQVGHIQNIRNKIPENEMLQFRTLMYSIGNMVLFPGRKVNGKWTINQARGCYRKTIGDRFDLTLECIRRYYQNESSPMTDTLTRYADFFELFGDFRGYVDFFMLNDLVNDDCTLVSFYLPFTDFGHQSPYPDSVDAFQAYMQGATKYMAARNKRIQEYAKKLG